MKIGQWETKRLADYIVDEGLMCEKQFATLSPTREQMINIVESDLKKIGEGKYTWHTDTNKWSNKDLEEYLLNNKILNIEELSMLTKEEKRNVVNLNLKL